MKPSDILKIFHKEKVFVRLKNCKWGYVYEIKSPKSVHRFYGRNFE